MFLRYSINDCAVICLSFVCSRNSNTRDFFMNQPIQTYYTGVSGAVLGDRMFEGLPISAQHKHKPQTYIDNKTTNTQDR